MPEQTSRLSGPDASELLQSATAAVSRWVSSGKRPRYASVHSASWRAEPISQYAPGQRSKMASARSRWRCASSSSPIISWTRPVPSAR